MLSSERFGRFNRLSALWNRKASWTTDYYLCAKGLSPRDVRLPQRGEFVVALGNAARIGIALLAGATFLVFAGWPASTSALTITAILRALSTTMPSPSKFAVAAVVSFALASVSTGIVGFYVLTEFSWSCSRRPTLKSTIRSLSFPNACSSLSPSGSCFWPCAWRGRCPRSASNTQSSERHRKH
jgi:hypothetical protein